MRTFSLLFIGCIVAACSREPAKASPVAAPETALTVTKPAALRLGEPVSALPVALSDVAKHPLAFEGRALATSGTVTAVCQNMGCWMEIRDEASSAHIRMHGHSFFIPKTASGRHARVQATVVPAEAAKECDENAAPGSAKDLARVELDATGVELD